MSQYIFNNLKRRFLSGEVSATFPVNLIPVNENFDEISDNENFTKLRTTDDIHQLFDNFTYATSAVDGKTYATAGDYYGLHGYKTTYVYSKVNTDNTTIKPDYITDTNFREFCSKNKLTDAQYAQAQYYISDDFANEEIGRMSGFYYVKTLDQLRWCADRVNNESSYNNVITIVLGDNIEGNESEGYAEISTIGTLEHPFKGVFDGFGHILSHISIVANSTCNGLIGYLAACGIIRNVVIGKQNDTCEITCAKHITLSHLQTDAADINTGVVCGINYGTIENVKVYGTFKFNNFMPAIYCNNNRTNSQLMYENADSPRDMTKLTNKYFPSYLCWNSPFNLVPYMGYFNQGIPFYTLGADHYRVPERPDGEQSWPSGTIEYYVNNIRSVFANIDDTSEETANLDGAEKVRYNSSSTNYDYYGDVWYATKYLYELENMEGNDWQVNVNRDEGSGDRIYTGDVLFNLPTKYFDACRSTYNCSPLVGLNNGYIHNVFEECTVSASENTFVGFIGGIAGKQNRGTLSQIATTLNFNQNVANRIAYDTVVNNRIRFFDNSNANSTYFMYDEPNDNNGTLQIVIARTTEDELDNGALTVFSAANEINYKSIDVISTPCQTVSAAVQFYSQDSVIRDDSVIADDIKQFFTSAYMPNNVSTEYVKLLKNSRNDVISFYRNSINYNVYNVNLAYVPLSEASRHSLMRFIVDKNITTNTEVNCFDTGFTYCTLSAVNPDDCVVIPVQANSADTSHTYFVASGAIQHVNDDPTAPISAGLAEVTYRIGCDIDSRLFAVENLTHSTIEVNNVNDTQHYSNYINNDAFEQNMQVSLTNVKLAINSAKTLQTVTNDDIILLSDSDNNVSNDFHDIVERYPTQIIFNKIILTSAAKVDTVDARRACCFSCHFTIDDLSKTNIQYKPSPNAAIVSGILLGSPSTYSLTVSSQASIDNRFESYVVNSALRETLQEAFNERNITRSESEGSVSNVQVTTHAVRYTDNGFKIIPNNRHTIKQNDASTANKYYLQFGLDTSLPTSLQYNKNYQSFSAFDNYNYYIVASAYKGVGTIPTEKYDGTDWYNKYVGFNRTNNPSEHMRACVSTNSDESNSASDYISYDATSIYNVGSVAGMYCYADDFLCSAVSGVFAMTDDYATSPASAIDFTLLTRFGGFAAKCEIQSNNVSTYQHERNIVNKAKLDIFAPDINCRSHLYDKATFIDCNFCNKNDMSLYTEIYNGVLSHGFIAEVNYLRQSMPGIYKLNAIGKFGSTGGGTAEFEPNSDRQHIPYPAQSTPVINFWNDSINNDMVSPKDNNVMSSIVKYARTDALSALFNFENTKATSTSAYINPMCNISTVAGTIGLADNEENRVWPGEFYGHYKKTISPHDFMAGDLMLLNKRVCMTNVSNSPYHNYVLPVRQGLYYNYAAHDMSNLNTSIHTTDYILKTFEGVNNNKDRNAIIATSSAYAPSAQHWQINFNLTQCSVFDIDSDTSSAIYDDIAAGTAEYKDTYFAYSADKVRSDELTDIVLDTPQVDVYYASNVREDNGYFFQDEWHERETIRSRYENFYGNSIHIGAKLTPEYIRANIAKYDAETHSEFSTVSADSYDFAGFRGILVTDTQRNLLTYIKFDTAVDVDNGFFKLDFPSSSSATSAYDVSAKLINISAKKVNV